MRNLRLIHVAVLSLLLLELVAYFIYAQQQNGPANLPDIDAIAEDSDDARLWRKYPQASVKIEMRTAPDNSCIAHPNQTQCVDFQLPGVEADLESLCGAMPHMAACSINNLCTSNTNLKQSTYCLPFSILKDICSGDMSPMSGCANYTSMCNPVDSLVKECATAVRYLLFFSRLVT